MMMGMVALGQAVAPAVPLAWDTNSPPAGLSFTNSNLTVTSNQTYMQSCVGNKSISGKKCWQINMTVDGDTTIGISQVPFDNQDAPGGGASVSDTGYGYNPHNTAVNGPNQGTYIANWGVASTNTDTWVVGFDSATLTFEVFKNGTSIGTTTCLAGTYYPSVGVYGNRQATIQSPPGVIPAGYTAL